MDPAAGAVCVPASGKPRFFATSAAFRGWLAKHHGSRDELLVGFWKVGSGKPSMTWSASVEQALAHGWIDGVRRSLGDEAYCIRFTPRKAGSHWSANNVVTAKRLIAQGRMTPKGAAAFKARRADRTARASYEQRAAARLAPAETRALKADAKAWAWFRQSPLSYQKACRWWIVSAKKPETRERRLRLLIDSSREGHVVPQYLWSKSAKADLAKARAARKSL
jgi:uncharacterized protein YdeI (YjbR/CyaY-like superfamily)